MNLLLAILAFLFFVSFALSGLSQCGEIFSVTPLNNTKKWKLKRKKCTSSWDGSKGIFYVIKFIAKRGLFWHTYSSYTRVGEKQTPIFRDEIDAFAQIKKDPFLNDSFKKEQYEW